MIACDLWDTVFFAVQSPCAGRARCAGVSTIPRTMFWFVCKIDTQALLITFLLLITVCLLLWNYMFMISVMEWLDNYLRNLLVDKSMEFGIPSCPIITYLLLNCTLYRHTSVVVFGKEVFYGHGINTTLPGRSHVSNHFLKSQL